MRESFVEDLRRMSIPQSKVAVRLRMNVLCWCRSEACRYSISGAKRNRNGGCDDFLLKSNIGH